MRKPEFKNGYFLLYGADGSVLRLVDGANWQGHVQRGFSLTPIEKPSKDVAPIEAAETKNARKK